MTELTTYEAQYAPAIADPTGGRLVAWADGLAAAHRIGTALCSTAFVPQHFKGKPEEAAAAILYGDEIGLTPTQSLQNLYVISGKPALYARTMVALVLAAGHEVWTVSKSDQSVTVAGRRRGSSHIVEETWTTARASKAGYTNNKKYATDPQAMLYARAASDVCRQIAPDALAGLAYSVEEIETDEPGETVTVSRTTPRKTTAKRAPVEVPEPDLEPVVGTIERDDEPEGEPLFNGGDRERAAKRMFAEFNKHPDLTDREDRLAYCAEIVGWGPVESSAALSTAELLTVADALSKREATS
jgi:hypothetical protein